MTIKKIECHTIDQHAKALADFYPGGKLWAAKGIADTTTRNMIIGLSYELQRVESYLKSFQEQFIPDQTELFLDDWEQALGIPDDCFLGTGTDDERRRAILIKLASLGVQTVEDFQNLAGLFNVVATVYPGEEAPIVVADPKFTIVVEFNVSGGFPYTFPIEFGSDEISILECLFNQLKPANCVVVFTAV